MCVTGMGNNMGKETGNVSQKRERSQARRTGILRRKKNEGWRKVKNGGKCVK